MKKLFIISMMALLLMGFTNAVQVIETDDGDDMMPPIIIPFEPLIESQGMPMAYGSSTQRYSMDYNLVIKVFDGYIELKNTGTQVGYESILWQSRENEQPIRTYIKPLLPDEKMILFTDTDKMMFDMLYWV